MLEAINGGKILVAAALSSNPPDTAVMIKTRHLSILTALAALWVSKQR